MTLLNITNKQQEILKYLYHFRFLNRIQIQALLKHKDYKTINLWLKDLTEKGYLNRIYSNKYIENTKPAIYYLGQNGISFLRANTDCPRSQINKLQRDKDRLQTFIADCQLLADIYLDLRNKSNEKTKYTVTTRSGFVSENSTFNFLTETTVDLVIEKAEASAKKYYIVEILDDTLPEYSVKKRIKNYIDFYYSNSWEDNTGQGFPAFILICENMPMLMGVKKLVRFFIANNEDIENFNIQLTIKSDGLQSMIN